MIPPAAALLLVLVPSVPVAEVFKCMENGKPVYSRSQISDNCTSMNVSGVTSQNIVSPGAQGFSTQDLDLLHDRKLAKQAVDRQSNAAFDRLSPEERARLAEEAVASGTILTGMNHQQVIDAIGEPTDVEVVPGSQGTKERWYYWVGSRIKHHLVMRNGGVVYYYKTPQDL